MLFNTQKFDYISFSSSLSSVNTNVYYSPNLDIIKPSENFIDLGTSMSSNCSFAYHINVLCKKCTDLSGWILRSFTSCDSNHHDDPVQDSDPVNIGLLFSVVVSPSD